MYFYLLNLLKTPILFYSILLCPQAIFILANDWLNHQALLNVEIKTNFSIQDALDRAVDL